MAKVVIVIPTYNERDNTARMIDTLADIVSAAKIHELHVLYVDGNSPDGTAGVIREYQQKYPWLNLLVEEKKDGLGTAYAKGMAHAMQNLGADYLMEFDSDFQHSPADIPRLVAEIDAGYDYIIGSRYVPGGSIPKEWGIDRKFLSVVGNLVARILLILPGIHDVTGGFKLARVRGFMDQFDFSTLLSKSFAYKIHLLFYMVQKGAKVKEVPIRFQPRTAGESKIIKNEMRETLRVIFLLQLHNPKMIRFFKFGAVGFIGYLVNALSLSLFSSLAFPEWAAWGASTELAIISNFTWNNLWTFKDDRITGSKQLFAKFLQFNFTSGGALLIQTALGTLGVTLFNLPRQLLLPVIIAFVVLPYNYLMYTLVIWRKKAPSQK